MEGNLVPSSVFLNQPLIVVLDICTFYFLALLERFTIKFITNGNLQIPEEVQETSAN